MQMTIYLYNITNKKTLQSIQLTAMRIGCKVKKITKEMVGYKTGYIAGLEEISDEPSEQSFTVPIESVLLLKGFTGQKLDQLLAGLRTAGMSRNVLKAMLNDNNQNWYFYELCQELKREHDGYKHTS